MNRLIVVAIIFILAGVIFIFSLRMLWWMLPIIAFISLIVLCVKLLDKNKSKRNNDTGDEDDGSWFGGN